MLVRSGSHSLPGVLFQVPELPPQDGNSLHRLASNDQSDIELMSAQSVSAITFYRDVTHQH